MTDKPVAFPQLTAEEVYDEVAESDYDETYYNPQLTPNYEVADRIVYDEIIAKIISKRDKIIEIGTGNGDTLKWLSRKIAPKHYIGIDPSKKMCAAAAKLYPDYHFIPKKLQELTLQKNYYDKALSIYAPPSYELEPNKLTEAIVACLKPGGIYISGPYTHLMAFGIRLQPNIIDQYPNTQRNFFLEKPYKELLEEHGLHIINEIGIDYVTHQQVYIDRQRKKLGIDTMKPIAYYYDHMKRFDLLAKEMGIAATDFRHCLYIAEKPINS